MARVLKARYFRKEEFLEAKLGSNPSFVWRSVLWGRDVLQKGLRWMIDDVNAILSIKLPRTIHEDKYAWHFDRSGMYSVRSGYKVALQTKYHDVPSCSGLLVIPRRNGISKAEFELLAASMWAIWHARNEFHFNKSISDPSSVLAKAEAMCNFYQRISFQEETAARSRSESTVTGWKPLPEN
ncbi:uncharacterized protein LOC112097822 [Citrus clementina]|uniref:uncharacterized protein LOC112097822 n=1 Tax=Citrus clementina TaxID=85681 RepID=UPI000CED03EC|nr:uncharacterized protein LOC112097822 [Citrus x clementina]